MTTPASELDRILQRAEDVFSTTYPEALLSARVRVSPQYGRDYLALRPNGPKKLLFHERLHANGSVKHQTLLQGAPLWFRIAAVEVLKDLAAALEAERKKNQERLAARGNVQGIFHGFQE